MLKFPKVRLVGSNEEGLYVALFLYRRLVVDLYRWPARKYSAWWHPKFGVLWDVRVGRYECQGRWR